MKRIDLQTIRAIADMIADSDDRDNEPGFLDTLEGETDAMEVADYLIDAALSDDALVEAMKSQERALKERRERIEWRAAQKRNAMLDVLRAIGVKKLERPRATISQRAGSERVEITDESAVPSQLCTVKTTTAPDKNAIKELLKIGEEIPGCALTRGKDGITMRIV